MSSSNNTEKTVSELYVDEIKSCLSSNRAAVLVGAGLSMNAVRVDASNKHMPGWIELADEFSVRLGIYPDDNNNRYSNPLSLAQQIEELYGKPYMNSLLQELINDVAYVPGAVHSLLISLPWSDIFTTNYDTLLERAYQMGTERRYKIIYTPEDLLYSAGTPRIIKLHGSFPSHEPFIISEEDYRRYPLDFAPFVNTVQQSLIENKFVLIGFSGNDPNFLNWIGWIHDNLGVKNAPKMYMIIHKHTSDVQMKMLAAKNIELVVLNDIERYHDSSYTVALERFLADLKDNKTNNSTRYWPTYASFGNDVTPIKMLDYLSFLHSTYPGWVTARNRSIDMSVSIANKIDLYIRRMGLNKKPTDDELELELKICSKFCWFCSITGIFLSEYTIKSFQYILKRHGELKSNDDYIQIELFILKNLRLLGQNDWEDLYWEVKKAILNTSVWNENYVLLCYENAMHKLYSLSWDSLEDAIRMIPCDNVHGEWVLRKAGLLSLLGYYKEATILLKNAMQYARRILLTASKDDFFTHSRVTSLESCMLSLLRYIEQVRKFSIHYEENKENDKKDKDVMREDNFGLHNFNYWYDFIWDLENEKISRMMMKRNKPNLSVDQKPSFDLDRIITNTSLGNNLSYYLYAMCFIMFRESTGHPFHIGTVTDNDGLLEAISRINWLSHRMSIVLAVMSGDIKAVETALSRISMATIPVDEIDQICKDAINLIRYSMHYASARNADGGENIVLYDYVFATVPELLSRLTVKCSENMFPDLLDVIKDIYAYNIRVLFSNVSNLVNRTIEMMPYNIFEQNLSKFWEIELKPYNAYWQINFPDPFHNAYLKVTKNNKENTYPINPVQESELKVLISKAMDPAYKNTILSRLLYINKIYDMPEYIKDDFNRLLWSNDNLDDYGLPNLGCFYKASALDYIYDVNAVEVLSRVETFVTKMVITYIRSKTLTDFSQLFGEVMFLINKITIDNYKLKKAVQVALLFSKMINGSVNPKLSFNIIDDKRIFDHVDKIVGMLILKSGIDLNDSLDVRKRVLQIVEILDNNDCPHALLSSCLDINDGTILLIDALVGVNTRFADNAIQAICCLVNAGAKVDIKILELLINSFVTALTFDINSFIYCLEFLLKKDLLNDESCDMIQKSLKKFDLLTKFNMQDDESVMLKKLSVRKAVSSLAKTLYTRAARHGEDFPEAVLYWKCLAKDIDEFAEIRLVWGME